MASIDAAQRSTVVKDFQRGMGDTGSPEVQVALLTQRILHLTEHFKIHKKDTHSRRGLMALVNRRRRLLAYLKKVNLQGYMELIKRLGLRR